MLLPTRIENWSPTGVQQRLVKTGGRPIKHARYYWLMRRSALPCSQTVAWSGAGMAATKQ